MELTEDGILVAEQSMTQIPNDLQHSTLALTWARRVIGEAQTDQLSSLSTYVINSRPYSTNFSYGKYSGQSISASTTVNRYPLDKFPTEGGLHGGCWRTGPANENNMANTNKKHIHTTESNSENEILTEGSLTLDTPQNNSRLRLLFRAYDKQTNNVEANSGLDWPQTLVRGCQFTFTYTNKSFVFLPPQITKERTSRLDDINCRQISKLSCNV